MKKCISRIIIIVLILNSIIPTLFFTVNAEDSYNFSEDSYKSFLEGEADVNGTTNYIEETPNMSASSATGIVGMVNAIANGVIAIMTIIVRPENADYFTIEDTIFGNISFFNIDFFNENEDDLEVHKALSESVSTWYFVLRNIAVVISLCVLIYIGIRMAISTVAEEKAKYKKMLMGWIESFILLFLLHYIIIIIVEFSKALTGILSGLSRENSFEVFIIEDIVDKMGNSTGWELASQAILFWMLVFYQLKFFLLYSKRLLTTAFLILISPFITVTYAIDKVGDNQAQAFKVWFKEILINIMIQPLHAFLYMIFMFSAFKIAEKAPLLAVLFLMGLSRGEKVVKNVFNMRGASSIHSMSETLKFGKKK